MEYKALRGMQDILPEDAALWQGVEAASRAVLETFGYREIRTPVLEEKGLFVKSIGGETDIVTKEMFAFKDRGEREVVMRPEGTAPIVRAYLEANLHKTDPFQKLYYVSPMFRAERPQAGRMRQFHQVGAEAIGSFDPALDAEMITLLASILSALDIKDYKIRINNLGCKDDKSKLSKELRAILSDKKAMLCEDCKKRLDANPLRVIDCKNEACRATVRSALKSVKFLCPKCEENFKKVLSYLDSSRLKYMLDPYIVRGLDYYTGTVFEVSHSGLGAQDAIGAGGRYDNLISDMGGPETGAVGFALGLERVLIAAEKEGVLQGRPEKKKLFYIATLGEAAHMKGFEILSALRSSCAGKFLFDMGYESKSLKAEMRNADKLKASFVLIIGDDEISKGEAAVRDMQSKEQIVVKLGSITKEIDKLC